MTSEDLGILLLRAAALLFGAVLTLLPLMLSGKVEVTSLVLAAPFFLAALAPLTLGPYVGKGAILLAASVTFCDPPSTITFHSDRFLYALPFFLIGFLLALPSLSQLLAQALLRR